MNFTRELSLPLTKFKNNSQKDLLYQNPPNIINLILPTHQKISSIFKLSNKFAQKLVLSKKGISLKKSFSKRKMSLKNKSSKNILEKINIKKKKNNSFYIPPNKDIQEEIKNFSHSHMNNNSETFLKLKTNNKNKKSYCSSRNISYCGNSVELNPNIIKNNPKKNIQKIKLTKLSSIKSKNKNNYFIPKNKTKLSLNSKSRNKNKNENIITKEKLIINNKCNNRYENNIINITDNKENINLTNLETHNINITEGLLFTRPKKKFSQTKLNLPLSPYSYKDNKDEFSHKNKTKTKKPFIRNNNNKNEINIPFNNKNIHLTRQSSYYNLINYRKQRNKKLKINTTREEANSFFESELYKKNNSMCSFDLSAKTHINSNSYVNTEFNNNYQNIKENKNDGDHNGVEINHFRIVKFIQDTKKMLINSGNKL